MINRGTNKTNYFNDIGMIELLQDFHFAHDLLSRLIVVEVGGLVDAFEGNLQEVVVTVSLT